MKNCRRCGEDKPLDLFPKDRRRPDGRFPYCKACHIGYQRQWGVANSARHEQREQRAVAKKKELQAADPGEYQRRSRGYLLKHRYGIKPEVYDQFFAHQNGVCAVCSKSPETERHGRLHIDHNHATGEVRGLLCFQCNILLTDESPDLLRAAARYLEWPPMESLREAS